MNNKDKKFAPSYRVGELAKLLSMHPQSVRYFSKVGLIQPIKQTNKKEKRYASYDAYKIMVRKQYSNMGFSVEETEQAFSSYTMRKLDKKMVKKIEEKEHMIQVQERILTGMKQLQDTIEHVAFFENRCFFRIRPATWHHLHLKNDHLYETSSAIAARKIAMNCMPLCRHSITIKKEDILTQDLPESTYCDLTINKENAEFFDFSQLEEAFFVPEQTCIYTCCKIDAFDSVNWSYLSHVDRFLIENNLKINGNAEFLPILNPLIADEDASERYRYFEVWIPVTSL